MHKHVRYQLVWFEHFRFIMMQCKQIIDLIHSPKADADNANDDLPRQARQLVKLMRPTSEISGYNLALALVEQEGDAVVARVRLQHLRKLIDETETYLNAQ